MRRAALALSANGPGRASISAMLVPQPASQLTPPSYLGDAVLLSNPPVARGRRRIDLMPLAPYACRPETSRGRAVPEPESALRSVYQRDRDRIVHSIPFRRLEYKTQVFVNFEGDHFRTRLTHTLEVAQIARAAGPGAAGRRGPGRGDGAGARPRPQRLRPCRRDGAGRGAGRLRRLRPQSADLPHRHPARAPLRGLRRAEPDRGDAGRPGQAQWAAAGARRLRPWPITRWRGGWR